MASVLESLTPLVDDVWRATDPVRIVGTQLSASMTVVRLRDGSVLLHSPVQLTAERKAAVERIGRVAHIYAPNLFHHLRVMDWSSAFPNARIHAPRGLQKKRPDLRIDRTIDTSDGAFGDEMEELTVDGFRLRETVLFHPTSRTLIVADLVHNVGRPEGGWTKFYASAMGFYDRVGLSRMLRWTAFSDREAARRSVERLLSLPFERVTVGHGEPVVIGAKQALSDALSFLPAAKTAQ